MVVKISGVVCSPYSVTALVQLYWDLMTFKKFNFLLPPNPIVYSAAVGFSDFNELSITKIGWIDVEI